MILSGPDYVAPAKINLFLHVIGRRSDGYHLLQTVFRLLDYGDILRFQIREDGVINRVNPLPNVSHDEDLIVRAAKALQKISNQSLGVDIELEKNLPMGGGVGGGSSDAATTLLVLNHLWQTKLSREQLTKIGLTLGADVPVFLFGKTSFAEGIGEKLDVINLPQAWYLVLTPPFSVSTKDIFSSSELTRDTKPIKLTAFSAGAEVFSEMHNDLEPVAIKSCPDIGRHIKWLSQFGNARMTGSGSSVFCKFATEAMAREALHQLPRDMKGFVAASCDTHPLHHLADV